MSNLIIKNLIKKYGENEVLKKINFEIKEGDFIAIMGPSGSGKTTLINCLSTIDKPTSGEILVDSENILKYNSNQIANFRKNDLGFIFQDYNLLDNLTVFENIALSLIARGVKKSIVDSEVNELAKLLNIQEILKQYPGQCSGGQQQRTSIARAVIKKPKFLFCDEPTGALDSENTKITVEALRKINENGNTILMVTHDIFTAAYAKTVLFIKDGNIYDVIKNDSDAKKAEKNLYKLIEKEI